MPTPFGIWIDTDTHGFIYNTGTIEAAGGKYSVAITSTGYSSDAIYNYGTITGSIWTWDNNDFLYNGEGGEWNAIEASYFGDGDDEILNYGTINMSDAAIYMGTYSEYGNSFYNFGTITVSGDNLIDMGEGWMRWSMR